MGCARLGAAAVFADAKTLPSKGLVTPELITGRGDVALMGAALTRERKAPETHENGPGIGSSASLVGWVSARSF